MFYKILESVYLFYLFLFNLIYLLFNRDILDYDKYISIVFDNIIEKYDFKNVKDIVIAYSYETYFYNTEDDKFLHSLNSSPKGVTYVDNENNNNVVFFIKPFLDNWKKDNNNIFDKINDIDVIVRHEYYHAIYQFSYLIKNNILDKVLEDEYNYEWGDSELEKGAILFSLYDIKQDLDKVFKKYKKGE